MKIQSVKKSKVNYSLLLVIFLFICSFSSLFSQTKDTLWTYDCGKYYLSNAVFSPDNQFIYATCSFTKHEVWKFDLQGNRIWVNDSVGGIKQFSEDGRFFWNYYWDKCDANTFQKLFPFAGGGFNTSWYYWDWEINEKSNIGIATTGDGVFIDKEYRRFYDSNIVIFRPSDMSIINFTSYPGKQFSFVTMALNPNGTESAFLIKSTARDYKGNLYTDTARIEIWNIQEFKKIREVKMQNFGNNIKLKYSPDGSVLGYQHDGKLTLYNTTDYSIVWESDELSIQNFAWSKDMNNLFFSTGIYGLYKLNYGNKDILHIYSNINSSKFIELNKEQSLILCSRGNKWIYLLNNNTTSINEPFFMKNYQVKLTQTTNEFSFKINSPEPAVGNYTISNMLGEIMQNPIQINISEGSNQFELNTADFPIGIYFLTLTISGSTQTLKFGVVR